MKSPLFVPFSMVGQVEMNYGNLYMDFKAGNSMEFIFLWMKAKNEKYGGSSSSGRGRALR
uniref:Uncharacterized protein n=1 Tax=Utricularia reniformis TaxID=192314 RepID=A0A1Y0B071_9LAMI|nr:hypothetical protein AEK19_MT0537 [Utricularia reniformis]ART30793.1 hypothetical protein AEK19_MT0537 [Utricularia reniformis]